jgi:hypothetical protein
MTARYTVSRKIWIPEVHTALFPLGGTVEKDGRKQTGYCGERRYVSPVCKETAKKIFEIYSKYGVPGRNRTLLPT